MRTGQCSTCYYFYTELTISRQGNAAGECRRNPPQVFLLPGAKGEMIRVSEFPPVQAQHYCGEFEPNVTTQ